MKFIFIENFTKLDKCQQDKFNTFAQKNKWYKNIIQKEIIFNEEALLLGFMDNDISTVFQQFNDYFKENDSVSSSIVRKTLDSDNKVILAYENSKKQIRI